VAGPGSIGPATTVRASAGAFGATPTAADYTRHRSTHAANAPADRIATGRERRGAPSVGPSDGAEALICEGLAQLRLGSFGAGGSDWGILLLGVKDLLLGGALQPLQGAYDRYGAAINAQALAQFLEVVSGLLWTKARSCFS
jgi:hypothetical protein